jgi:hypothetical protein
MLPSMSARETVRFTGHPLLPRAVNVVLGAWLVASAFVLPHFGNAGFNNLITGLLICATALQAFWAPALHWVNTALAAWVAFGALAFDYPSRVTRLHDLAIAGVMLVASLIPGRLPPEEAAA